MIIVPSFHSLHFVASLLLCFRFERVWRGLKGRPDLFAEYLGCFKKSTFKKVLKEAVSPDLLSFMWQALRDHSPGAKTQLRALEGFASTPGFSLALSLLPEGDLSCVRSMLLSLTAAAGAGGSSSELQDLCALYGV
jgi:hypothetical protein